MKKPQVKPLAKLPAWSNSRYSTYKLCPAKIKHSVYDKIKEPPSAPMLRGVRLHKDCEMYLKHKIDELPEELKYCVKDIKAVRDMDAVAEDSWNFREDWTEADNVFAKDVWLRIKVDAYYMKSDGHMVIVDWKTGQIRDGYEEQLELYALGAFKLFDDSLHTVEVLNYYLDEAEYRGGKKDGLIYYRDKHEARLTTRWKAKVKAMMNDTRFAPTKNNLCAWCFYRASNKGPCKYG